MASPPPDALTGLLESLTRGLESRGITFMLIGGQAVLLHGRPRFTEDIDATLGVGPDRLGTVLETCSAAALDALPADIPAFVRETFVLPTRHEPSGLRVDLIFSTLPYEAEAIQRAVPLAPAVRRIQERFARLPVRDSRPADQILGYDERGLPN